MNQATGRRGTPSAPLAPSALLALLALALLGAACSGPRWLVARIADRTPEVVFYVETGDPAVALTIDDGPDPRTTPAILDALRRHGARATFFLISERVDGNEDLVARIVGEGHEIGNHGTREEAAIRLEPEAFERSLLEAGERLEVFAPLVWYRPGSGFFDEEMIETSERHGYRVALGSLFPLDTLVPWSGFHRAFLLWGARPGSVIVLHDAGARGERTAATLDEVLPRLRERGLRVTTLSELADAERAGAGAVEEEPPSS